MNSYVAYPIRPDNYMFTLFARCTHIGKGWYTLELELAGKTHKTTFRAKPEGKLEVQIEEIVRQKLEELRESILFLFDDDDPQYSFPLTVTESLYPWS